MNLSDITDIKKLTLNEGEVLVITLSNDGLTERAWNEHARHIRELFRTMLLTQNILVVSEKLKFDIMNKNDILPDIN